MSRQSKSTEIRPGHFDGPGRWRQAEWAWGFSALLIVALGIYWPGLSGAFLWDDPAHVTRPALRTWAGLGRIWFEPGATQQYYPVLNTAFWLEHRLWGDDVRPYHLVNVILHAANSLLLVLLLRRLWSWSQERIVPVGTGWLAAGLFMVHPVGVESVLWISEQKNTLSTFFCLLSALGYLGFARDRKVRTYALATVLFLLALGTKTVTATLPAALLVVLWWLHGRLEWRRHVLPLLPWLALAIAAGLVTARLEGDFVGADRVVPDLTLLQHTLLAAKIFWFYVGKLLWPVGLTFFYPLWDVPTESAGWLGGLLAGLAVTIVLWLLRHRARGPLALWLLYGGTLFPVLGFFKIFPFSFSYVADHFQYLALPSGMAAVAAGWTLAFARFPSLPRWLGPGLACALVFLLAVLSRGHSRLYQDNETLFRANLAANPSSWMGHHILGVTVGRDAARWDEAVAFFRRAIVLKADNPDSMAALAALLVRKPGHGPEAVALLEEALRLRPGFAEAHNALGNELAELPGRLPEAIAHYEESLRLRPDYWLTRANLAQALARVPGRQEEALRLFREVLVLVPGHAPAQFHLASLLAGLPGREGEAVPHYEEAIRLEPNAAEAPARLGDLLVRLGRRDEAVTRYQQALRLDPGMAPVHYCLAEVLVGSPGRAEDAERHAREAVRLQPDHYDAWNLLGVLCVRRGAMAEARACWQQALVLRPDFEPARINLERSRRNGGQ